MLTGEADPEAQARCFLSYGCPNVVITMDGRGVAATNQHAVIRVPAFAGSVVDPSGARDAFGAGHIYTESVQRLRQLGRWLQVNGEAI